MNVCCCCYTRNSEAISPFSYIVIVFWNLTTSHEKRQKRKSSKNNSKTEVNMKTKESYSISLAIIDIAAGQSEEGQGLIAVCRQLVQTIQKEEDVLNTQEFSQTSHAR